MIGDGLPCLTRVLNVFLYIKPEGSLQAVDVDKHTLLVKKTLKVKQKYSKCQFYLSPVLILHRNKYTQEKLRILIKCPKVAFEMLSILSSKFFESLALCNQLLVGCRC